MLHFISVISIIESNIQEYKLAVGVGCIILYKILFGILIQNDYLNLLESCNGGFGNWISVSVFPSFIPVGNIIEADFGHAVCINRMNIVVLACKSDI